MIKSRLTFITTSRYYNPAKIILRVLYYYAILMALFYIYMVQKQHTPPPFIYNQF